jgi:phosphotriesterase-related protein
VRGPVDAADLGTTLMHEHVFVLTPDLLANYRHEYWDEELRVADAIDKLTRLCGLGVRTTVVGLGRYVPRVARVNAEVDLNIVVATGLSRGQPRAIPRNAVIAVAASGPVGSA